MARVAGSLYVGDHAPYARHCDNDTRNTERGCNNTTTLPAPPSCATTTRHTAPGWGHDPRCALVFVIVRCRRLPTTPAATDDPYRRSHWAWRVTWWHGVKQQQWTIRRQRRGAAQLLAVVQLHHSWLCCWDSPTAPRECRHRSTSIPPANSRSPSPLHPQRRAAAFQYSSCHRPMLPLRHFFNTCQFRRRPAANIPPLNPQVYRSSSIADMAAMVANGNGLRRVSYGVIQERASGSLYQSISGNIPENIRFRVTGKQFSRLDNLPQHPQVVHADKLEQNEHMMHNLTSFPATMTAANEVGSTRGV
ncbi:hypothetical protein BDZ97DRAFT_1923450 [Flammula alnicola]|nr:hypothetical protein BDZ97DRAFT_1923450 [Flammula alnicola]